MKDPEILALYQTGMSLKTIGKQAHRSGQTIRKIVLAAGLELHQQGGDRWRKGTGQFASEQEYNAHYYATHRENILPSARARSKVWHQMNKPHRNARDRAKRVTDTAAGRPPGHHQRAYRERLRKQVFDAYGNACACCGETITEFLTIDHVNGGGRQHRKNLNHSSSALYMAIITADFSAEYRILCYNCNRSAYVGKGVCIHQRST